MPRIGTNGTPGVRNGRATSASLLPLVPPISMAGDRDIELDANHDVVSLLHNFGINIPPQYAAALWTEFKLPDGSTVACV